jgi:hypothetical protein
LGEEECGPLRLEALAWLRADLDGWHRRLGEEPDRTRSDLVRKMQHWLADADFAGVRGPDALARLPEAERHAWQQLWADVAETLARAEATGAPAEKEE